jgi:hypothetical protein
MGREGERRGSGRGVDGEWGDMRWRRGLMIYSTSGKRGGVKPAMRHQTASENGEWGAGTRQRVEECGAGSGGLAWDVSPFAAGGA